MLACANFNVFEYQQAVRGLNSFGIAPCCFCMNFAVFGFASRPVNFAVIGLIYGFVVGVCCVWLRPVSIGRAFPFGSGFYRFRFASFLRNAFAPSKSLTHVPLATRLVLWEFIYPGFASRPHALYFCHVVAIPTEFLPWEIVQPLPFLGFPLFCFSVFLFFCFSVFLFSVFCFLFSVFCFLFSVFCLFCCVL